jgi:hypothetical protein
MTTFNIRMYDIFRHEHTIEIIDKDIKSLKDYIDIRFTTLENRFATKEDLSNTKAEIVKWMFIFWVGQLVATFGFILLFLRK